MGEAKRDGNYITTLIAVSNVDGVTPVTLYADPTTHRLLVSSSPPTTYTETPGGLVNGSNTVYTTANAITTVFGIWINGMYIHPAEYTLGASGFTMGTALPAELSGTGFTIVYQ